ncbi:MAG TPA: IS256 family transposase [Arenicellales bacterium]|jgi:transposase-like protein|nr:IS256 family transposase [Candidatus Neomarinimicrobiota bacterium]HJL54015.1 IS256 family transposase [Arenicellales bacterium]|tara:strand:+ start:477 stop:1721 length:1245 start_codon:yes stop_codon:yes gene_type:complete
MKNNTVIDLDNPEEIDPLTELLRTGAKKLIAEAIQAELDEQMTQYEDQKTADGRRRVVRSGHHPEREIVTGVGKVSVEVPKIRSRDGEPESFQSMVVPPYIRRTATLDAAIPWLYLKGVSSGQMQSALEAIVGPQAKGLSSNVVGRLKRQWEVEYKEWCTCSVADEWVYIWADGIYSGLRGDDGKLCCLVIIGVNSRGQKHFLAIEDGVRESKQSWREVLLSLQQRGLRQSPKLAVGDGALGFWAALEEVYPATLIQRCWMHKTGNVLNYLPKSVQEKAKQGIHDIWMAEGRAEAERAFDHFEDRFGAKYPKAVECLSKDRDVMLTFYDFPAEHWIHIRTTNVIESSFATIRHRTRQAKGCVTRNTMLTMIYKMGQCAEDSWRRLRGFRHLAKVIEGVTFKDGIEVTDDDKAAA